MAIVMGKSCFAPNCTSRYKSNREKVSLFTAPLDEERFQKWMEAIPESDRIFSYEDHLCARHFEKRFITTTIHGKKSISRLSKEAFPTLWPDCSKHMTKPSKEPRKPNSSSTPGNSSNPAKSINCVLGVSMSERRTTMDQEPQMTISVMEEPLDEFTNLWINVDDIQMPDTSWAAHALEIQDFRSVVFNEVIVTGRKSCAIIRKQVSWDAKFGVHAYIFSNPVDLELSSCTDKLTIVEKAEAIIQSFHAQQVCEGGPSVELYKGCEVGCAFVDQLGKWRHYSCTWLPTDMSTCDYCREVDNAMQMYAASKKKTGEALQNLIRKGKKRK